MSIHTRLRKLAQVAAERRPPDAMVIQCAAVGTEMAAGRPAGIYPRVPGTWQADVVFDGPEPGEELLERARNLLGRTALIIILGPTTIEPPTSYPGD